MTLPDFYQPDQIGQPITPDTTAAVNAGRQAGFSVAADDTHKTALLLVDMQVDFIYPTGALAVPGAVDDTKRLVEWMYHNTGSITTIYASLDSHLPVQIFSPAWWVNADDQHPEPYTVITHAAVKNGEWQPVYKPDWSIQYTEQLEETARKQLMIWPYHTLIGTPGHTLIPAVYEAIAYHASAREAQPIFIQKGTIPETEHYSMFEPEVKLVGAPESELNTQLLDSLAEYDRVFIAGQAKSHCVLESVTSIMRYFDGQPDIIRKIHLLTDAMSSVAHPEIDFDAMANEQLAQYEKHGLNLTTTDDV